MQVNLNSRILFGLGVFISLLVLVSCIFQNEGSDKKSKMDGTWLYVGTESNGVINDQGIGIDVGMIIRGGEAISFYSGSECTLLSTNFTSTVDSMELSFGNSNDTIKAFLDDSTLVIYVKNDRLSQKPTCPESFYTYNVDVNHLNPDSGSLIDLSDTLRMEISYSLDEKVTNPELYYLSGRVRASDGLKRIFLIDDLLIKDTVSVNIPIDDPLVLSSVENGLLAFNVVIMFKANGYVGQNVHMPMFVTPDYIYQYN